MKEKLRIKNLELESLRANHNRAKTKVASVIAEKERVLNPHVRPFNGPASLFLNNFNTLSTFNNKTNMTLEA